MRKVPVIATLAAVLIGGPAFADQHYLVVASDPSNHATIKVPNGDQLQLKLTACEDCGYQWKIVDKPNAAVIAFEKRQSSVSHCGAPPPCTGGTATERWLFQSKAVGSTVVRLGYFGPGKNKPSKVKSLDLAVTA
jgi:predicted secreted protein